MPVAVNASAQRNGTESQTGSGHYVRRMSHLNFGVADQVRQYKWRQAIHECLLGITGTPKEIGGQRRIDKDKVGNEQESE